MITCQDCGAQAVTGVGYCPSCGSRLPFRQVNGKAARTPAEHQANEHHPRQLIRQMAAGKTLALVLCLIFFALTSMNVSSWKDRLPAWVPFISQSQTPPEYEHADSASNNEYRESAWTEQLITFLQNGKLAEGQAVIDEQIARNPLNERIYELAGTLLAEHGYGVEAATIWIMGMEQTGIRQIPEQMRTHLTPSDIPVSPALSNAVNKYIHIPVDKLAWSDLDRIHTLAVYDADPIAALPDADAAGILQVSLDDPDEAWGISEWIWLPQLKNLRWESSRSPDVATLRALTQLQHLRLKQSISSPADLEAIYALHQLRSLVVTNGELADLAGIENLQMLEHLSLYRSRATSLTPLQSLPVLKQLQLNGSHSLASADELSALDALRELVLEGGELLQMQALGNLKQLEALTLRQTAIKDISFIEQLPFLRRLTLEQNTALTNWQPLARLSDLEQLHLQVSSVDELPELAGLVKLTRLSLDGVRDLQPLSAMTNLQHLALSGASARADLRPVAQLSRLEHLSLSDGTALEDGTAQIFALPSLKRLEINRISLYQNMDGIASMNTLEELVINHSSLPLSLSALSQLEGLRLLALNDTSFINNVSIYREGAVSRIYYDDLAWSEQLANWSPPPNLVRLELASNALIDANFATGLAQLRELILTDNSLTTIEPLSQLPQLQFLDVRGNPILDQQAADILPDATLLLMD